VAAASTDNQIISCKNALGREVCDRKVLLRFLLEEIEEEEDLLLGELNIRNADVHPMFKLRQQEGYFNILIRRHLSGDDVKFREFFRLNREQFFFCS